MLGFHFGHTVLTHSHLTFWFSCAGPYLVMAPTGDQLSFPGPKWATDMEREGRKLRLDMLDRTSKLSGKMNILGCEVFTSEGPSGKMTAITPTGEGSVCDLAPNEGCFHRLS